MKEEITNTLVQLEKDLAIYNEAAQNSNLPETHKGPVSFKFLSEMIRYNTLRELVPDYTPGMSSEVMVAQGLAENGKLVSINDGKVVVSPQFEELIKLQNQFKNGKIS